MFLSLSLCKLAAKYTGLLHNLSIEIRRRHCDKARASLVSFLSVHRTKRRRRRFSLMKGKRRRERRRRQCRPQSDIRQREKATRSHNDIADLHVRLVGDWSFAHRTLIIWLHLQKRPLNEKDGQLNYSTLLFLFLSSFGYDRSSFFCSASGGVITRTAISGKITTCSIGTASRLVWWLNSSVTRATSTG